MTLSSTLGPPAATISLPALSTRASSAWSTDTVPSVFTLTCSFTPENTSHSPDTILAFTASMAASVPGATVSWFRGDTFTKSSARPP